MEASNELRLVKDIIQTFLKARKNIRMYPSNNPIYMKTVEDTYKKIEDFFSIYDELKLRIKQNELLLGSEPVYQNTSKDDNLALFFFKDGLRELSLLRGISQEELKEFLEILASDFEREDIEEDVVTLLWQKDFSHIKYIVDETVLTEDETYEEEATRQAKSVSPEVDDLKRAHQDAIRVEEEKAPPLVPITESDLAQLSKMLARDTTERKTDKLIELLYELLYRAESTEEIKDIIEIINNSINFTISRGDIEGAVKILKRAGELTTSSLQEDLKRALNMVFEYASSEDAIRALAEFLDKDTGIDESVFGEYVRLLTKNAIAPFITVLGEMKTINARKLITNALIFLGSKDITSLAKGLKDDRWYVVRNIIYILRMIGDRSAVDYLTSAIRHNDPRVRKEVLKALGELRLQGVVQTIKDCLDDPDDSVRASAVRALASTKTELAKKVIMERILDKDFINRDFKEKKEYFEALSNWNDPEVFDFLIRTLKKKTIFKRSKNDENRACAAYALGLLGNNDALSALHKVRDSGSKLLSEYAYAAIRRIEYGR